MYFVSYFYMSFSMSCSISPVLSFVRSLFSYVFRCIVISVDRSVFRYLAIGYFFMGFFRSLGRYLFLSPVRYVVNVFIYVVRCFVRYFVR